MGRIKEVEGWKSRDCNPDPVFSMIRDWESLIPGSRQDRDSGIRDSTVLNPGIKKTGTGLQTSPVNRHYISVTYMEN